MNACLTVMLVLAATSAASALPTSGKVLLDFRKSGAVTQVTTSDARVEPTGLGLRVTTGHSQNWPGITVKAPGGNWNLKPYGELVVTVRNTSAHAVNLFCRVDNEGADGVSNCLNGQGSAQPGATAQVRVTLQDNGGSSNAIHLFGMRGFPAGVAGVGIDTSKIPQIVLFLSQPSESYSLVVTDIRVEGARPAPPSVEHFFPFIDTFGQYKHNTWPGKVRSLADLRSRVATENADLKKHTGPADWDRWGGWSKGPKLKATGAFRVVKRDGRWWLVDPDGHLFFSNGIDCVSTLDTTPIDQRDQWFENFPGDDPALAAFCSSAYCLHGFYAGKSPKCFGFAGANLLRKYGPQWSQAWNAVAHRRLRSWGLNTIGNWSARSVVEMDRTPYVATLGTGGRSIEGSQGYWGKFPDVFDPEFENQVVARMAREAGRSAADPYCVGYFVDNEMSWGDELSLAIGALMSPADQPAKRAFIDDLRAKYGEIAKLNQAWGSAYASWDDLSEKRTAPDQAKAKEDLAAFYSRTAEQYFRLVRAALRRAAPNRLYLGCRFAWANPRAIRAAAKYCDVVSFNLYQRSVRDYKLPEGVDVPIVIGEFHFGALDRGMFHTGLVPTSSQQERAQAYRSYVTGALQNPNIVGCHWFEYQDEPTTGRVYDAENYQIGFVDVCDTPYPETIAAARAVGASLYRTRSGVAPSAR